MSAKVIKLQDNSNNTLLPVTDASLVQMTVGTETKSVKDVILEDEEVTAAAYNELNNEIAEKQDKPVYLRLSSTTSGNTTTYSLPKTFDEIIELIDNGTPVHVIANDDANDVILYNIISSSEANGDPMSILYWESHVSLGTVGNFICCTCWKDGVSVGTDLVKFDNIAISNSFASSDHTHTNESLGYGIATCSTAANISAKEITISNFSLKTGGIITVCFTNGHSVSGMTIKINSGPANTVFYGTQGASGQLIHANDYVTMIFNGTAWNIISIHNAGETVKAYSATTTTSYLIGVIDETHQVPHYDPGVYLTTNAGELRATSFNENGTTLANKYLTLANSTSYIKTEGTGLSKSGQTLNHSNSVSAKTVGSSATGSTNISNGSTFAIPYFQYDAQGHINAAAGMHSYTLNVSELPNNIVTGFEQWSKTTYLIATKGTSTYTVSQSTLAVSDVATKDYVTARLGNLSGALKYKGTLAGGTTGSYGALTPAASSGDVYIVSSNGKINGETVEVGDMVICRTNTVASTSSNYSTIVSNWTIVPINFTVSDGSEVIEVPYTTTESGPFTIATVDGKDITTKVKHAQVNTTGTASGNTSIVSNMGSGQQIVVTGLSYDNGHITGYTTANIFSTDSLSTMTGEYRAAAKSSYIKLTNNNGEIGFYDAGATNYDGTNIAYIQFSYTNTSTNKKGIGIKVTYKDTNTAIHNWSSTLGKTNDTSNTNVVNPYLNLGPYAVASGASHVQFKGDTYIGFTGNPTSHVGQLTSYWSKNVINNSTASNVTDTASALTNGNVYLKHVETNGTTTKLSSAHKISGNNGITVTTTSTAPSSILIQHSNTGKTKTEGLYNFAVDAQGHVTAGSEINTTTVTNTMKYGVLASSVPDLNESWLQSATGRSSALPPTSYIMVGMTGTIYFADERAK